MFKLPHRMLLMLKFNLLYELLKSVKLIFIIYNNHRFYMTPYNNCSICKLGCATCDENQCLTCDESYYLNGLTCSNL